MANPERTVLLDLSAIEEARGPQPNDFFVCVTRREAALCATAIAWMLETGECEQGECDNCNRICRLFWDLMNELGPRLQWEVRDYLGRHGVPLPETPWEEVR